jgi:pyrroline-5-carboxylate reductase
MKDLKITFIGAGKMAEAVLKGILAAKLFRPNDILMTDIKEDRLKELKTTYKVNTSVNNASSADGANIVLLAIKPQQAESVLTELSSVLQPDQLLLSIMAGTTLKALDKNNRLKVARLMPNTPALIGQAMTVSSYNSRINQDDKKIVSQIFDSIGETLELPEKFLNSVTAVSGSGPAFVFRILEATISAAMEIGLPYQQARKLVFQTFKGSTMLAQEMDVELQQLVQQVSSPGGTTVAGRNVLENSDYKNVIKNTILAAKNRADELSEGSN